MSQIQYISTSQIRSDLVGFLESLFNGAKYQVINRSSPIGGIVMSVPREQAMDNSKSGSNLVDISLKIQAQSSNNSEALGPKENYKTRYRKDMAKKYGIS
jgi:hypothetical protein